MKSLNDKCILVIDDDPGLLRALSKVLRSEGAAAICASWAGEAVEILTSRKYQFDLVITDLRMPFVTGITVVYAIHEIFPALPTIVLSAFATPELKAACREQGAVAFLEKPVDSEQLILAVRRALGLEGPEAGGEQERRKGFDQRRRSRKAEPSPQASARNPPGLGRPRWLEML